MPIPFLSDVTMRAGDFNSLCSLFFDNLSTLIGLTGALGSLGAADADTKNTIIYARIIPAMGIMLFVGNTFFAHQAIRMKKANDGREFTAQPYGLNTVGGYPFVFGIAAAVMFSTTADEIDECAAALIADGGQQACDNGKFTLAWEVTVAANFLTGALNILVGLVGPKVVQVAPFGAMIVPLAGIGYTWLAFNQIAPNFGSPAPGFLPMFLIFVTYYAKTRITIGSWRIPEALHVVIVGLILGWSYGLAHTDGVSDAADAIQTPGIWVGGAFISGLGKIGPYLGVVLPISIAASFEDMECLVSAQKAGDPFPIRETMVVDGLFTMIGAILGSPFGTVIYLGHPVHKANGAQTGYSFMNGCIYLILCLSGIFPIVVSLFPKVTIGPIIFIFGMMICEECTKHIPQRHHCAIFFGLFFSISDYLNGDANGDKFGTGEEGSGLSAMRKGFALNAMLWVTIVIYTVDRRWLRAATWAAIAAVFALFGIIHQDSIDMSKFTDGTMTGGTLGDNPNRPRWNTSPLQFMIGYLSIAAFCLILHFLQGAAPEKYPQPITGEIGEIEGLVAIWDEPIKKTWEETGGNINALQPADPEGAAAKLEGGIKVKEKTVVEEASPKEESA